MTEKLENKLIEMIESGEALGGEVFHEYVRWMTIYHSILIAVGVLLLVVVLLIIYCWHRYLKDKPDDYSLSTDEDYLAVISSILGVTTLVISVLLILFNITGLIKIIVAPKVYILERLSELL